MNRDPKLISLLFNEYINMHDTKGISGLMSDDFTFIDCEGNTLTSKGKMIDTWKHFFDEFPEYRNYFSELKSCNDLVVIFGYAYWNEEKTYDAVIWTSRIKDDLITEWCIYSDTIINREKFNPDERI